MIDKKPVLEVKNLKIAFKIPIKEGFFKHSNTLLYAVNDISFNLYEKETLGIVGESGCGKSTLARAILKLLSENDTISGKIVLLQKDITNFNDKQLQPIRKDMQVIFQDPLASLNPRMTIYEIISEPLRVYSPELTKQELLAKVKEILPLVGLGEHMLYRYPHEFSGGQCQRIGIARAVILQPKLLICDEAVSALDVSIKAQIINLLQDLKKAFGMSLIFISHDLSIVNYISDRIMVLYLGHVMEIAVASTIYNSSYHPYTKALISAIPIPDPKLERNKVKINLLGDIPSPFDIQRGCPFASRCPSVFQKCYTLSPTLQQVGKSIVACHLYSK